MLQQLGLDVQEQDWTLQGRPHGQRCLQQRRRCQLDGVPHVLFANGGFLQIWHHAFGAAGLFNHASPSQNGTKSFQRHVENLSPHGKLWCQVSKADMVVWQRAVGDASLEAAHDSRAEASFTQLAHGVGAIRVQPKICGN